MDLRIVEPGPAALRTFARLGQLVFAEREAARTAARGFDHHLVAGRACGSNEVPEIVFDVAAFKPELARER